MRWRYRLRKQRLLDECEVPPYARDPLSALFGYWFIAALWDYALATMPLADGRWFGYAQLANGLETNRGG
jgi:hypothetical protein